jgi:trimethylamine---corrinoid protein Co-methyltransferase
MTTTRPRLSLFTEAQVESVVADALRVLASVGFVVENREAAELLAAAGLPGGGGRVLADEKAVRKALATAPAHVLVYDRDGEAALDLGGDRVHFDPGSSVLHFLDPASGRQRPPRSEDLVHLAWVTQACRHLAGQSTALVPSDVPEGLADRWRLHVALQNCTKPVITGTFRTDGFAPMKAMLVAIRGSEQALAARPLAIFDCCPSPPLKWSDLTCQALIDCARSGIPAELVSMPLAGATSPVTLAAAVVQHTAECLSGVTIHQLARAGSPIVWGGSPAAFDMREGTTPMGDVGTWLIDCAYSQVGKSLGLPTHAYLGMSDAKIVDAQCGLESCGGTILAAMAGVNMVSGAGMMDFESCQSLEKLVIDAEAIGMAKRLILGVEPHEHPIALTMMRKLGHRADYLGEPHTLKWFAKELYLPSPVIDRGSLDAWHKKGAKSAFERARDRVKQVIGAYQPVARDAALLKELRRIATTAARQFGMQDLPPLPGGPQGA